MNVWTPTKLTNVLDLTVPSAGNLYVATLTALVKSTDGGATFTELRDAGVPIEATSVSAFPPDPRIVVVASYGAIRRSTDGGATWTSLGGSTWATVAIDPSDARVLFATTITDVFRSADGGASWTKTFSTGTLSIQVWRVLIAPGNPDLVVTAAISTFHGPGPWSLEVSTDGGVTWVSRRSFFGSFAVGAGSNAPIYVRGIQSSNRLERSLDAGATWTTLPAAGSFFALAASPTAPGFLCVGNPGVACSTDGGATFRPSAFGLDGAGALALDPDSAQLYAITGGALFTFRRVPLTLVDVSPSVSADLLGSVPVTLTGTGFAPGMSVAVGGIPAAVTFLDTEHVRIVPGPHYGGTVDVVARLGDDQTATLASAFTYAGVCSRAPSAVVSGSSTTCSGDEAALAVALQGTPPFTLYWSDGFIESGLASGTSVRRVSPGATTRYRVDVVADAACAAAGDGEATILVNPRPPYAFISLPAHLVALRRPSPAAAVSSDVQPAAGTTFEWGVENGTITAGQHTSQITFQPDHPGPGNLFLVEIGPTGCRSSLITTSFQVEDPDVVIPVALDAPGKNGARFTTRLVLARGRVEGDVALRYQDALSAGMHARAELHLGALEQVTIPDAIAYLREHGGLPPADGQPRVGTVVVENLGAPESVAALARTTSPSGPGRAGLAYAGTKPTAAFTGRSYLFGLRETALERTNVALVNAALQGSDETVTLRVTLHGDGREPLALPDLALAAQQWVQLDSVLSRAGLTSGWASVERVAGTAPYLAYSVVNDNGTNDGAYQTALAEDLPAPNNGRLALLPVLVETDRYESELVLGNPWDEPVRARIVYSESLSPAHGPGTPVTVAIAPRSQLVVPGALDWLRRQGGIPAPSGGPHAGAARIAFTSLAGEEKQVFCWARTATTGDRRYGVSYEALPYDRVALSSALVYGLSRTAGERSNLALVNGSDFPNKLWVCVRDGLGRVAGACQSLTLAAGEWRQFDDVLAQPAFVRDPLTEGYADIQGSGLPFLAYGVINDGGAPGEGTGDGSYLTMVPSR